MADADRNRSRSATNFDFGQRLQIRKSWRNSQAQASGFHSGRRAQGHAPHRLQPSPEGVMKAIVNDLLGSHAPIDPVAISPEQVLDRDPAAQESASVGGIPAALRLDEPDQPLEIEQVDGDFEEKRAGPLADTAPWRFQAAQA